MKKIVITALMLVFLMVIYVSCTTNRTIIDDNNSPVIVTEQYNGISLTVVTIKKNSMDFSVVTENPTNNDFYMNSNFFTPSAKPIGEVISNGVKINSRVKGGGFFYTKNGQPMITIGKHPKNVDNCSQTSYVGIINGVVNEKMVNRGVNKQKAYRTLIGKNLDGDLVIIVSNRLGLISMGDISNFGISKGIRLGLIFDGGSSVDIGINNDYSFKSVPGIGKKLGKIHEPPVYIVGNFKNN